MTKWYIVSAVICFSLGYRLDPFKSRAVFKGPTSAQITQDLKKIETYIAVGNTQGAQALIKRIKKYDPKNEAVTILEGRLASRIQSHPENAMVERLPSSLRDSFYDSFIAAKAGDCAEALSRLKPVQKFLKEEGAARLPTQWASRCEGGQPTKAISVGK